MPTWFAVLPFLMPVQFEPGDTPQQPDCDYTHRICRVRDVGGSGGAGGNAINNYYFNLPGAQGGAGGSGGSVIRGQPSGDSPSYPGGAVGRWAIGGAANCNAPAKAYVMSVSGRSIVWRNGVGDTDVEAIVFSGDGGFGTRTTRSTHASGSAYAPGTSWTYTRLGNDRMQVTRGGGGSFTLSRC